MPVDRNPLVSLRGSECHTSQESCHCPEKRWCCLSIGCQGTQGRGSVAGKTGGGCSQSVCQCSQECVSVIGKAAVANSRSRCQRMQQFSWRMTAARCDLLSAACEGFQDPTPGSAVCRFCNCCLSFLERVFVTPRNRGTRSPNCRPSSWDQRMRLTGLPSNAPACGDTRSRMCRMRLQ